MKKVYVMIVITIIFFLLSFGVFFKTNVYLDIAMVIIYLLLAGRMVLKLEDSKTNEEDTYVLQESKLSYFTPLIFIPFLGLTYSFGYPSFIINILLILLLFVYVYVLTKRNKLTITSEGISMVYLNKKTDSMLFSEVEKVEFNWVYNYIGFINGEGKKLILDITFEDYILVLNAIKDNLPEEMSAVAFKHLSTYYKLFLLQSNKKYL